MAFGGLIVGEEEGPSSVPHNLLNVKVQRAQGGIQTCANLRSEGKTVRMRVGENGRRFAVCLTRPPFRHKCANILSV